jgi:hypothetical protein
MSELKGSIKRMAEILEAKPPEDNLADAKRQGQAQFESIKEMVEALERANESAWEAPPEPFGNFDDANEAARRAIEEDALSVQVRSGWYQPGAKDADKAPAEYEILLCTGGPACRIVGQLSEHGEPTTARLEVQDWFQPWTEYRPTNPDDKTFASRIDTKAESIMLTYARCFYFGEG